MARSRGSARGGSSSRGSVFGSGRPQARQASTVAAPAASGNPYSHPPAAAGAGSRPAGAQAGAGSSSQPGLFSQMASTAAGVAVGSAVGHTLGAGLTGMFSGSGSQPVEAQPQAQAQQSESPAMACDVDARNFTRCLDENNGNFQICDYYLQQLKACQEAARHY